MNSLADRIGYIYEHPVEAAPSVSIDFLTAYTSLDADNRRLVRELVMALSEKQRSRGFTQTED